MKKLRSLFGALLIFAVALPGLYGQSVTGQISGTVTDSTGGSIVGAVVRLTHDLSQQPRSFTTEASGSFVFTNLVPGKYSLRIEMPGFRAYDQKAITVAAQERVDLHDIRLTIGEVTSTIEVAAAVVHVATDSSDRSIAI